MAAVCGVPVRRVESGNLFEGYADERPPTRIFWASDRRQQPPIRRALPCSTAAHGGRTLHPASWVCVCRVDRPWQEVVFPMYAKQQKEKHAPSSCCVSHRASKENPKHQCNGNPCGANRMSERHDPFQSRAPAPFRLVRKAGYPNNLYACVPGSRRVLLQATASSQSASGLLQNSAGRRLRSGEAAPCGQIGEVVA